MKKHNSSARHFATLAVFLLLLAPLGASAQVNPWRGVPESVIAAGRERQITPIAYRTMSLDAAALESVLARAPMEFTAAAANSAVEFALPRPDGTTERFRLVESPMISAAVAKERPDWKSYAGRGIDDPTALTRLSWSNEGFSAYVIGKDGAYYVDSYAQGDRENYIVYFKDDAVSSAKGDFHCAIDQYFAQAGARDEKGTKARSVVPPMPEFSVGANLRTYRVAIATTGEYTVARGGQASALTSVMNGVNRINLVYRRDLAVALTLVSGTSVVFPNPATDPYNNTDEEAQLAINHNTLTSAIGTANFDIGHLFGTGGGGVASSPSVCDDNAKGEGYSARGTTTGDPFFIDYVSHEMGHQLSAQHTYNNADAGGACTTRSAADAYEVASGSTIMSYVGICENRNLQQFTDDVFHERSLIQIINYVTADQGNTCGTVTATGNVAPVANAGAEPHHPEADALHPHGERD